MENSFPTKEEKRKIIHLTKTIFIWCNITQYVEVYLILCVGLAIIFYLKLACIFPPPVPTTVQFNVVPKKKVKSTNINIAEKSYGCMDDDRTKPINIIFWNKPSKLPLDFCSFLFSSRT